MKLVLTLLVRDEIDIIKSMLDFHLSQGIDQIIITDNGSIDGTFEVCKAYENSHPVVVLTEPASDFSQHRWVSKMANMAYEEYHADWIIHADADELFVIDEQYKEIKNYLHSIPKNISVLNVARTDFVPFKRPMEHIPHLEMVYRKTISLNLEGQILPKKIIHRGSPNVIVSQGNHTVIGDFLDSSPTDTNEIMVYHYPIRSYPQFASKVRNGGSGYSQNTELDKKKGFHKRYWYELLQKNKLEQLYNQSYQFDSEKIQQSINSKTIIKDSRVADMFKNV